MKINLKNLIRIIVFTKLIALIIGSSSTTFANMSTDKSIKTIKDKKTYEAIKPDEDLYNRSKEMIWKDLSNRFRTLEDMGVKKKQDSAMLDNKKHCSKGQCIKGELDKEIQDLMLGLDVAESEQPPRKFSGLYVFVSSSMPKQLLKNYYMEVSRYGGALVFRGLPNGSFKEFIELVMEIMEKEKISMLNVEENLRKTRISEGTEPKSTAEKLAPGVIQIDDEAFERFGVRATPVIVVSRDEEYLPSKNMEQGTGSKKPIFDKIDGNVGVKFALEEFSRSGELKQEAQLYLNKIQSAK